MLTLMTYIIQSGQARDCVDFICGFQGFLETLFHGYVGVSERRGSFAAIRRGLDLVLKGGFNIAASLLVLRPYITNLTVLELRYSKVFSEHPKWVVAGSYCKISKDSTRGVQQKPETQ